MFVITNMKVLTVSVLCRVHHSAFASGSLSPLRVDEAVDLNRGRQT